MGLPIVEDISEPCAITVAYLEYPDSVLIKNHQKILRIIFVFPELNMKFLCCIIGTLWCVPELANLLEPQHPRCGCLSLYMSGECSRSHQRCHKPSVSFERPSASI